MVVQSPQFERLLRIEDEEIAVDGEFDEQVLNESDSCKVPMIYDGNRDKQDSDKLRQVKAATTQESVFQFTLNGRRIQISSEHLKYISLITLTLQNAALNLVMRAARTQPDQFSTPVAVTMSEMLKLLSCLVLIWLEEASFTAMIRKFRTNVIDNYLDTLKVAIPSFVYYIQNNLLYVGSTNLDAATCQVTYQLKILTTACFSVAMLNKKLSKTQWASLVALFVGVALIESLVVSESNTGDSDNLSMSKSLHKNSRVEKPILGFLAILSACCLSGFAGVYFEKILKNTSHVSLWIRNVQLSAATIPIGLIQISFYDNIAREKGLLHGFTSLTWLCIMLQAQGGLLVALVVKFANNILKGFATSMAIVISTVASMLLFDFHLTATFVFGSSLVIASVMMYNR